MKNFKAKNIYLIITGVVFLLLSVTVFAFDNPFKKNEVGTIMTTSQEEKETNESEEAVEEKTEEIKEDSKEDSKENEEVIEEKEEDSSSDESVFGPEYGDKVTDDTEKKIIDPILDKFFNVSYREVKANPDDYKADALNYAGYIFTDYSRDSEGILINDPITSVGFVETLIAGYADNDIEMKVSFEPKCSFDGEYNDTYTNGKLTVTFFSGKDVTDIAELFAIDNPEFNKAYTSDFFIGYKKNDDGTYKLTDLVPGLVKVNEVYGD